VKNIYEYIDTDEIVSSLGKALEGMDLQATSRMVQVAAQAVRGNRGQIDLSFVASQFEDTDFFAIAQAVQVHHPQLKGIADTYRRMPIFDENFLEDFRRVITDISETELANISKKLSYDEREEMQQIVAEVLSDEDNWQQRLFQAMEEWKERNPVYYRILKGLASIIVMLSISIASMQITGCAGILREEPDVVAEKVLYLESEMTFVVVDEISYWAKIEVLLDDDIGTASGWIGKRQINKHFQIVPPGEGDDSDDEDAE